MKKFIFSLLIIFLCFGLNAQNDRLGANLFGIIVTPVAGDTYQVEGNYNDPSGVTDGNDLAIGDVLWTVGANAGDTCRVMAITDIVTAFAGYVVFEVDVNGQGAPSTQNSKLMRLTPDNNLVYIPQQGNEGLIECISQYFAFQVDVGLSDVDLSLADSMLVVRDSLAAIRENALLDANNLSDVDDAAISRANIGADIAANVNIVDAGGYYIATEVEAALQEEAVNRIAVDLLVGDLISLTGVPFSSTTLGTFVNPILLDNAAIKPVFEAFADSVSARLALDLDIDPTNELQTSETLPATPFAGVLGTTSQEQIEELYNLIPGVSLNSSNVLFVSKGLGNNSMAQFGSSVFPWADPWVARDSAVANAISNPVIIITDGNFLFGYNSGDYLATTAEGISLFRDGFTYFSFSGVSFISNSNPSNDYLWGFLVDYGSTYSSFKFLGNADVVLNDGVIGIYTQPGANVQFSFNKITHQASGEALFALPSGSYYLTKPGGMASFDLSIRELRMNTGNGRFFGFWGRTTTDTLDINLSINLGKLTINGSRDLFAFDPIYYRTDMRVNIDEFVISSTGTKTLCETLRAGFLNSYVSFNIKYLNALSAFGFELGGNNANRKPSRNSIFKFTIPEFRGDLRAFSGANLNPLDTLVSYYYDLSGFKTGTTTVYNIPNILSGVNWNISGVIRATNPILAVPTVSTHVTLLNAVFITETGVPLTIPSGRTLTTEFIDSYFSGSTAVILSNRVINASKTVMVPQPARDYVMTYNALLGSPIWYSQIFTAAAAQVDFTVTGGKLPSDSANVRVFNNTGAKLRETDHYTYVPATGVVTLVAPATAGEKYTIEYLQ